MNQNPVDGENKGGGRRVRETEVKQEKTDGHSLNGENSGVVTNVSICFSLPLEIERVQNQQ